MDRFESETIAFHERIREVYLKLAEAEPERFLVLNAIEKPQVIFQKMIDHIEKRINL